MKLRLLLLGALGAIFLQGASEAIAAGPELSTTGDRSELRETIPIEDSPGNFLPIMRLDPQSFPAFAVGDRLRVSAEYTVTTDCIFSSPRCSGRPYTFDPRIDTRLVLSVNGRFKVLGRDQRRCLQRPGQREHHCTIVFHGVEAGGLAAREACDTQPCTILVEARAHNNRGGSGENVVIGGQEPNGRIVQDKGRINAIALPPGTETTKEAGSLIRAGVPPDLKLRVIYSVRLNRLERGEVVEAHVDARGLVDHIPYPALISAQIVLAESPRARHGRTFAKKVSMLSGEFTEASGSNCTQIKSPCPVFRTGALRIRRDARRKGEWEPLWVNVVTRAASKRAEHDRSDRVRFQNVGGLEIRRYAAPGSG